MQGKTLRYSSGNVLQFKMAEILVIKLKMTNAAEFSVEIAGSETIAELKTACAEKSGVPAS